MVESIRNDTKTIGTDSVVVGQELHDGTQRSFICITNVSTGGQVINLSVGQTAVANTGIQLNVGGTYQETMDAGYKPTNQQIQAISSIAGGTIAIQERIFWRSF